MQGTTSSQLQDGWFTAAGGIGEAAEVAAGQSYRGRLTVEAFRVEATFVILYARDHIESRSNADPQARWSATGATT